MRPIKKSEELSIAYKELAYQYEEKKKREDELTIANKELAYQNQEKEKRAIELIIANRELAFQNNEKIKRAKELIIANQEIIYQNKQRSNEILLFNELKKTKEFLTEHIKGLEKIIFMTSHKVRHPVVNILGLIELISNGAHTADEMLKFVSYLKKSALTLDEYTRELTIYMENLRHQDDVKKLH